MVVENPPKVLIIGGGIIGVSTALELQRQCPGVQVTILADQVTPCTTGDGAAGLFSLFLLGDTPLDKQVEWSRKTHDLLERLWKTPGSGSRLGLSLLPAVRLNNHSLPAPWADVVFSYRELSQQELRDIGRLEGEHQNGVEFLTFTAEPVKLLPFFMAQFTSAGGRVERARLASLTSAGLTPYDVLVNCTGLGSRDLAGDETIQPLRGQVSRVKAPWARKIILDDSDDGNYVIPNIDSVVTGGTHQLGDWDTTPREEDSVFIKEGSTALMPSLAHAEKVRDWVGLRPFRPSVRLERETVEGRSIVHNYGHGGSGITVFQGCAEDAVDLIKEALSEKNLSPSELSKL